MAKLDKLVSGQRKHDMSEDFSLIAEEAIRTSEYMLYGLMIAAAKVFATANADKKSEGWGGRYAAMVTYWAGFLEGVRTQKQKQRKKAKEKPLSDANAKRQELKILANNTNSKSL